MGRMLYLTRLALGLSAFEDVDESLDSCIELSTATADAEGQHVTLPHQKYDAKGRPVNPDTERRNTAMRGAENAVLSLVGVVESNDCSDRLEERKYQSIREARQVVLAAENDRGEDLEIAGKVLETLQYPLETVVFRVQAGIFNSPSSVIDTLLGSFHPSGVKPHQALMSPFPGAVAHATVAIIRLLLSLVITQGANKLSTWTIRQRLRTDTAVRILTALILISQAAQTCFDVAILPLEYYAYAQQLGLVPAWPLFPSWRTFMPLQLVSVNSFAWSTQVKYTHVGRLCSPAVVMLAYSALWREHDEDRPIGAQLTVFEYPELNAPRDEIEPPDALDDPLGWLMYQGYVLRKAILRCLGWTIVRRVYNPKTSDRFENNRLLCNDNGNKSESSGSSTSSEADRLEHRHRSTALAHLPVQYLNHRLEHWFAFMISWPLRSLMLRSIAKSCFESPLPNTDEAFAVAPWLYTPFGGGPLSLLRSARFSWQGWTELGSYMGKAGISLGLCCSYEIGVFFVLYRLARWQGLKNFDWGFPGRIGNVQYRRLSEEASKSEDGEDRL